MINKEIVKTLTEEWLQGNEYFLVDVNFAADDRIVIEIDHADGVWIEDCAELSRFLQERLGEELGEYELRNQVVTEKQIAAFQKSYEEWSKNFDVDVSESLLSDK